MPTASYVKIPAAIEDLLETGNAATDQWAIALASSVPASKVFTTGTTDLATAGGYTQGGANGTVMGYWDYGSTVVIAAGDTFAFSFDSNAFTVT
jgi:hypothetical protein